MAFFVNPPEGANHSLKCVKSKIDTTFTIKTFKNKQFDAWSKKIFKSKLIHLVTLSFSEWGVYLETKDFFRKTCSFMIFLKNNLHSIFVLIFCTFEDMSWFRDPGIQDSRSALELASFDWYQHVGYESHSVYIKKLDFQHRISKFHHSWKLPEIFWNSGYRLEMANFLPISTWRVLFPLSFRPRTWFSMRNSKIPSIMESSWN